MSIAADPQLSIGKKAVQFDQAPGKDMTDMLAKMDSPDATDASRFQNIMGDTNLNQFQLSGKNVGEANALNAPEGGTLPAGSPFDLQFNRFEAHQAPTATKEAPSLTSGMEKLTDKVFSINKTQEAELRGKINDIIQQDRPISSTESLQLEYEMHGLMLTTEIVTKGVNQGVRAIQTGIRNQ